MILYLVFSVPLYCLIRQALDLFTYFGPKILTIYTHFFSFRLENDHLSVHSHTARRLSERKETS